MSASRLIRAAILPDYDQPIEVTTVTLDAPQHGEVLVRLVAAGVCHSDGHVVTGHLPLPTPIVLGHEGAGVVEEVGMGVTHLRPGDRVMVSWIPACGHCWWCVNGQPELCEQANTSAVSGERPDGSTRLHWHNAPLYPFSSAGTWAEAAVVPATSVVPIPDHLPYAEAALLGCAVQTGVGAALRSPLRPGDTVAVIGCGGVGLNIIQGARIRGASTILAVDPAAENRELALIMGAHHAINPAQEDALTAVLDLTDDRGVDVAFEAVGQPELIALAFAAARRGGTAIAVGVPTPNATVSVNAFAFASQEKTLTGSWFGGSYAPRDVPRLIALWERQQLQLTSLIRRQYSLDAAGEALYQLLHHPAGRNLITLHSSPVPPDISEKGA